MDLCVVLLEDGYPRVLGDEGYDNRLNNLMSVVHCRPSSTKDMELCTRVERDPGPTITLPAASSSVGLQDTAPGVILTNTSPSSLLETYRDTSVKRTEFHLVLVHLHCCLQHCNLSLLCLFISFGPTKIL